MFLLDTNVCIDFIDARNEVTRRRIVGSLPRGLSVSSITAAELLVGARRSEDPKGDKEKVRQFLAIVPVHDFGMEAAQAYATIIERLGMHRRSFDRLIAAHALALGLTLVTNNEKHFADVPGLMVENWALR